MNFINFIKRNGIKTLLLPAFIFINIFYYPYIYYFYRRKLNVTTNQQQLFFLARDEYGAILHLLYYIHCWTNARNGAVLVILTPHFALVERLAKYICPLAQIISPRDWFSHFIRKFFSIFMPRLVFKSIYNNILQKYPEEIHLYEIKEGAKCGYVKYLDDVYENRPHDSEFWNAYVQTRGVFDCRYDVYQDCIKLSKVSSGITVDKGSIAHLLDDLKVSGKYSIINLNVKNYFNETRNIRRIWNYERYNVLIDYLIEKGYSVILQGTGEQPYFNSRKGFIDYAHSDFQSVENDLLLFGGCEFFVTSKTGGEMYGLLCDKPVLGLNYTELCAMQPNTRFRFFPKHIKDIKGQYLSWRTILADPVYFQLGNNLPTQEKIEFFEMEEDEIIAALEEFLQLLPKPREQWLNYSLGQSEFKQMLHPGHLDLYHISGVPCDVYIKGRSGLNH